MLLFLIHAQIHARSLEQLCQSTTLSWVTMMSGTLTLIVLQSVVLTAWAWTLDQPQALQTVEPLLLTHRVRLIHIPLREGA